MQINISSKSLDLTASITAYINDKLGSLDKFVRKYEEMGDLELKIMIARTTAHHHKGEVFEASADLILPGKNLHAEEIHEDVRIAIDGVRDKLHTEIEKYRKDD